LTVQIIGFSPSDRTIFTAAFDLSKKRAIEYVEYREPSYSRPRRRADIYIADSDDLRAMVALNAKSPEPTHPAILVGRDSHGWLWSTIERPLHWRRFFQLLDQTVEAIDQARATLQVHDPQGWPFVERRLKDRLDLELVRQDQPPHS
jgi:hypothetical protein